MLASPSSHGRSRKNQNCNYGPLCTLAVVPIPHDTALYHRRHKIEIIFGRLRDWRRIHTRFDRCAHTYMSAICIAATVIFWL